MIKDFPASELKSLKRIQDTMKTGLCHCIAMYEDSMLKGYAVFIIPKKNDDYCSYGLLDYFAITKENRGMNYGHLFFQNLVPFLTEHFPWLKGLFIECESIISSKKAEEEMIRQRRINFYLDNNCVLTPLGSNLFDVEYSVLLYPVVSDVCLTNSEYLKELSYVYKAMFKRKHLNNNVHMWVRLGEDTLTMPATKLAPFLIGKLLCRNIDGNIIRYRITETECYYGEEDTACHAHRGKTPRNSVLYEKGGTAYIYLCYGMHNLFNVVSGNEGHPEAVLIRGVENFSGPGRLTKAMSIDKKLNGENMLQSDTLWLEDDLYKSKYTRHKRIGIEYATKKYRDILWRYLKI